MADHLTPLGFTVRTVAEFEELIAHAASLGEGLSAGDAGAYVRWPCGEDGVELWVKVSQGGQVAACQPHFAPADASPPLAFTAPRRVTDPGLALEGALLGTVGGAPLAAHVADFARAPEPGDPATLQVTAVAEAIEVFEDAEAFAEATGRALGELDALDPRGPDDALVGEWPIGAQAELSGTIERCDMLRNPLMNGRFWRFVLRTDAGLLDAVAPSGAVRKRPRPGKVVDGIFWLTGRWS
jgi:hypothetical protein